MSKKRGQNEGSIRQRKDGKYEVRITAGIEQQVREAAGMSTKPKDDATKAKSAKD